MEIPRTAIDPVCLMKINPTEAAEYEDYKDQRYYFCNSTCHTAFQLDPERYATRVDDQGAT